jgi:hypothetical protein
MLLKYRDGRDFPIAHTLAGSLPEKWNTCFGLSNNHSIMQKLVIVGYLRIEYAIALLIVYLG